jgi:DNA polymerase elongation subunit (family B)
MKEIISQEVIENFLNGSDPEEYIVGLEYDYRTNKIFKVIQDPLRGKIIKEDKFVPFLWCGDLTGLNFYNNSKSEQRKKMTEYGIIIEKLRTDGNERLERGLTHLVKSLKGYTELLNFFKQGGIDPWSDKIIDKESKKMVKDLFQILNPVEQFLVQKKKRLFKGIENYSDVYRLVFDIETTGLVPENDRIILIGIKDNRGFQKTISAFGENGEENCIKEFFDIIREKKPTIIGGYNSASFDFPFILKRAEILGMNIRELTQIYTLDGIKQKEGILKLANEIEPYTQFILWGFNIIDIAHSVRRAQAINSEIKSWGLKYVTQYIEKEKPNRVYVDGAFISKIYLDNELYYMNPKSGNYRKIGTPGTEDLMTKYPGKFEIWGGKKIVEQYLDDDLYETLVVDDSFSQSTFLLSKLVPTTYERVSTMGTATLWKMIMSAWSYENGLAIPEKGEKRAITGGLSRLINVGYAKNIVKFDYSSLYPSIQLVYDVFPECDIMGVQRSLLKYFRDMRIMYKNLTAEYKDSNPELSEAYDRKQLPIKIFINAYFGSLSAPKVFPWGDMNKGEMITCTGRQVLRMMIMYFLKRGYKPLVMDTDGVNFETPENRDEYTYIGKGLNELVKLGKEYKGVEADVAEFNDIFMRNEMGLDIDYFAPACVNVSRKNYIIKIMKKGKEKIKLTGNTIKSKKIQQYISDFLDEGFKYLLNGDGYSFIELYYQHVEKIYNKQIPLAKIANKSRVKQTVKEYLQHVKKTTKSGSLMSRQAHMELIIQNNYPASLGETIYYINNGVKKSSGDVQKITKPTKKQQEEYMSKHGKPMPNDFIEINCYMISESELQNDPEKIGEYNVIRYLNNFNKRVEPLLVAFKPEIREDILVEDPKDRQYFTKTQCELVSGYPMKEGGQDDINDVLTLSDSEVLFWNRVNVDPYYMYLEDSLKYVDKEWIEHNRKVLKYQEESIHNNEDEEIIETDGNDYAYHVINS